MPASPPWITRFFRLALSRAPLAQRRLDHLLGEALEDWSPRAALFFLWLGANPSHPSRYGPPLVCRAARLGSRQILRSLLRFGASPIERAEGGWAPLHFAALKDHALVCEDLCDAGVPVDDPAPPGWSPLFIACKENRSEALEALLRRGASFDQLDSRGETALLLCARRGFDRCARLLVEHGANPSALDRRGFSALHLAASSGHATLALWLVDQVGLDPQAPGPWGKSSIDLARAEEHLDLASALERAALDRDCPAEPAAASPRRGSRRL